VSSARCRAPISVPPSLSSIRLRRSAMPGQAKQHLCASCPRPPRHPGRQRISREIADGSTRSCSAISVWFSPALQ
jgi:hypothetical protein